MMTRSEYGELYDRTMGKNIDHEDCRQGFERWQEIWNSGMDALALHPTGTPMPTPQPTDYYLVATCEGLRFIARAGEEHFRLLPDRWTAFARDVRLMKGLKETGQRSAARAFLHCGLVDGLWLDPELGAAMGACIVWLITSHHGIGRMVVGHHMLGYDIAHVPGPAGQARMFNFRTIVARAFDEGLMQAAARALPLPPWQAPPH